VRLATALMIAVALVVVPSANSTVSASIVSGVHGDNGWYVSPVKVQITSTGAGTCPNAIITFTTSSDTFQCTDDGIQLGPLQFNIDSTPPTVTSVSPDRAADHDGWYTHPVNVAFSGSDSGSGIASCTSTTYSGPDGTAGSASGTCRDKAGNVSSPASFAVKYDATPPTATATPGRKPTTAGWYNHTVSVAFAGTDGTSGVASCTAPVRYAGPDTAAGTITGTCTDQAGNQGSATLQLKYDSTPPHISDVATSVASGGVTVSWRSSGGMAATVLRSPGRGKAKVSIVYHGPASSYRDRSIKKGVVYHYTVATTDPAGNDARVKVATTLRLALTPAAGAVVHPGDALTWVSAPGATYYNVQLFRGATKILTAWPVTARFRLPRAWTFAGHRQKLTHGTYKWYVWPGHGARAAARYGRLLGGSTFRVR